MTVARNVRTRSDIEHDPADYLSITNQDPSDLVAAFDRALRRIVDARPAWTATAACRGTELDFTSNAPKTIAAALQLCGRCDHLSSCRSYADDTGDTVAVMGGEDAAARRNRWRTTGITPPPSLAGPTEWTPRDDKDCNHLSTNEGTD